MELFCVNVCATLHNLHKTCTNTAAKSDKRHLNVYFLFSAPSKNGAKKGQKSIKKRPFLTFKAVQNAG